VICTLGNHATKLISGSPAGITRVHGRPQVFELAGQAMYLYPIFHPAAALYTRAMLGTLQEDFLRLPELLAGPRPQAGAAQPESGQPAPAPAVRAAAAAPAAPAASTGASDVAGGPVPAGSAEKAPTRDEPEQLGLF